MHIYHVHFSDVFSEMLADCPGGQKRSQYLISFILIFLLGKSSTYFHFLVFFAFRFWLDAIWHASSGCYLTCMQYIYKYIYSKFRSTAKRSSHRYIYIYIYIYISMRWPLCGWSELWIYIFIYILHACQVASWACMSDSIQSKTKCKKNKKMKIRRWFP